MDLDPTAHEATGASNQEECDDPDCVCHQDTGQLRPGEGAAEVTMTEVYDIDIPGATTPAAGNTSQPADLSPSGR